MKIILLWWIDLLCWIELVSVLFLHSLRVDLQFKNKDVCYLLNVYLKCNPSYKSAYKRYSWCFDRLLFNVSQSL